MVRSVRIGGNWDFGAFTGAVLSDGWGIKNEVVFSFPAMNRPSRDRGRSLVLKEGVGCRKASEGQVFQDLGKRETFSDGQSFQEPGRIFGDGAGLSER